MDEQLDGAGLDHLRGSRIPEILLFFMGCNRSASHATRMKKASDALNCLGDPNLKWIARDLKSAFNKVSIQEIYFGLPERHNLNMDILSPKNPFAERILFWVLLLEKMPNKY